MYKSKKDQITYLHQNNTSYTINLLNKLKLLYKSWKENKNDVNQLKYYQYLVNVMMTNPEYGIGEKGNARGMLIYHSMGTGKTMLAVSIAFSMLNIREPIILVSLSLQSNFKDTVKKYVEFLYPHVDIEILIKKQKQYADKFKYISFDAYNMIQQVSKATTNINDGSLDNKLLIVDEAHNLFRSIINGKSEITNSKRFYNLVMNAQNLRILFLTGTPSSKDPFELVPCFNMLAGYELLPVYYQNFYDNYIDKVNLEIINKKKLMNRLNGLVSHISNSLPYDPDDDKTEIENRFPIKYKNIIEYVEMSKEQYSRYLLIRRIESGGLYKRNKSSNTHQVSLSLPQSESSESKTYYVKSRMISNYNPEEYNFTEEEKTLKIGVENLSFTPEQSPKIMKMLENIKKYPGPGLIYSQFRDIGGILAVSKYLEEDGYIYYKNKTDTTIGKVYATISGEITQKERDHIQKLYNSINNIHGEVIYLLLITKTGVEGLDLKGVRQIHKLEPYWDKAREDQIDGRGHRMDSHSHLPLEERNVQPFLYIATANKSILEDMKKNKETSKEIIEEDTVDEMLHKNAVKKYHLNVKFREMLKEVCVECLTNNYGNCHSCIPNNKELFHVDSNLDLRVDDPCSAIQEDEVQVKEFKYNGNTYYYKKDDNNENVIIFYEYNQDLESYIAISMTSDLYFELYELYKKI